MSTKSNVQNSKLNKEKIYLIRCSNDSINPRLAGVWQRSSDKITYNRGAERPKENKEREKKRVGRWGGDEWRVGSRFRLENCSRAIVVHVCAHASKKKKKKNTRRQKRKEEAKAEGMTMMLLVVRHVCISRTWIINQGRIIKSLIFKNTRAGSGLRTHALQFLSLSLSLSFGLFPAFFISPQEKKEEFSPVKKKQNNAASAASFPPL